MKKRITEKAANFLPDYIVNSVTDVDFEYLSRQGIKACLFDLDHTILHHGTTIIQPKILEHIHESGMKVYIATNRVYSEVLDEIAVQLKADGVVHAMRGDFAKPSRAYYAHAIQKTGCKPEQIIMIGDRILQDIWGSRRSGLRAILLSKFGPIKWWDRTTVINGHIYVLHCVNGTIR
jgi:HAD superfamily phosphatase (TIGR01668 family)